MKKIFGFIAASLLSATLVSASGTADPTATSAVAVTRARGTSVFKLYYKSPRTTDVHITIQDGRGSVLLTDRVRSSDGFLRPYNFGELPEGEYTLVLEDFSGRQVQKLNYSDGRIEKFAHVIKMEEPDKYLLTVATEAKDKISIRIFDAAERLLYEKSHDVEYHFATIFNIKDVKSFRIDISDGNGLLKSITY